MYLRPGYRLFVIRELGNEPEEIKHNDVYANVFYRSYIWQIVDVDDCVIAANTSAPFVGSSGGRRHEVYRLKAGGMSAKDIAKVTGYTLDYVYKLLRKHK